METTFLIVTSIAADTHPILVRLATEAMEHGIRCLIVGDRKSPSNFELAGSEFLSIQQQQQLDFQLATTLPENHYARKNLGYLAAMQAGASVIIETDDDNLPGPGFWAARRREQQACFYQGTGWHNVYRHFIDQPVWPRGFALARLTETPALSEQEIRVQSPIQQGLADDNPDVDAVYRLTGSLPLVFSDGPSIALGEGSICPFNSQNTTWFREAFPLLYLPSTCSFRMTDIWRSFIAQRIGWTCDWPVLFHASTVVQERNDHDLMLDFRDEIPGYLHNEAIMEALSALELEQGPKNITINMQRCYQCLVDIELIDVAELALLDAWLNDIKATL